MNTANSPFLNRVAKRYLELTDENQRSVCLVFPNRRASLFFRKELLELNPTNQWVPEIFSADEFVRHSMQQHPIDSVTALFEFYTVYRNTEAEKADPFDVYLTWAPQLLHDFEEVDLYLVDADALYKCVDANYAMEKWSPDQQPISEIQKAYLHFWSMMGIWYSTFRAHLTSKKLSTTGMVYRAFAENIKEKGLQLDCDKVLFCGFSALNGAEQKIIKFLEKTGRAEVIWDIDNYYIDDELNEAGHFFRKYRNDWAAHTFKNIPARIDSPAQQFEFIGVAKNLGQVIETGALLYELASQGERFEDTAVVLSDERLLMPMLEVIPEKVPTVNVTMSYPLHQLPVMGLYSIVFDLHRRCRTSDNGATAYYFKDVLRLLRQPNISQILGEAYCQNFIKQINKSSHNYLNVLNWENSAELNAKLGFLFKPWNQIAGNAIWALVRITELLLQKNSQIEHHLGYTNDALEQAKNVLNRLSNYDTQYPEILTTVSLQRVFAQLLRQLSLAFYGEPLQGLQLMGLLETRNVEFKNLILLSVNEGILPASRAHRTFIPFDIAIDFGLPTYRDRDALFAYHFYRMIQGAERIWLIYNTENDEFGKGEQSRFITQLKQELKHAKQSQSIRIPELPAHQNGPIRVEKTPDIISQIKVRYNPKEADDDKRGLSATALKAFVNCSLSYYLRYFSKVKPEEDREDEVEANQFGTICHKTLQDLYEPFAGKVLQAKNIEAMQVKLLEVLKRNFLEELNVKAIESGKHLLAFETMKNMLRRFLKYELNTQIEDAKNGIFTSIVALETNLKKTLTIASNGEEIPLLLIGNADRIDIRDQTTRILDYKTGGTQKTDISYNSFEEIFTRPDREKAMQLMFYQLLYADKNTQDSIQSGIVPLKSPSKGILMVKQLNEDHDNQITDGFSKLIARIFDPSEAFEQTDEVDRCKYCDFKGLCNRL